ncbi:Di-copper centre-containing protein [Parathielavia appendiculata]|uniref:Di-copper centre-containing protein n=1 Tax=Parathielavia appendiculata TaxID=2587402 RepID=A0AAN6U3W8_9PEZI|nr:Di-copper centre-containing protein [Parathielavia appendiculata]
MRSVSLIVLILQAAVPIFAAPAPADTVASNPEDALKQLQALADAASEQAKQDVSSNTVAARAANGCTLSNLQVRREWGTLSASEKKSYINAVKCLMSKPGKTPTSMAPGVKNRFDDFVAVHINQTMEIHYTGSFLSWHRYFTWLYEKALQTECGYKGTQPYWNWGFSALTGLESSPIFDGSDTSMSGNGAAIPNQPDILIGTNNGLPPIVLPPGTGGGCVTSGPFKNMSVNMGPVSLSLPGGATGSNPAGPLAYNPRCLKRDLTTKINQRFANGTAILSNILVPKDVDAFQMQMQGIPGTGNIGIHGGGHYSMGGDPGRDFFVSPSDPAFYLHHSMIDRVWWIWQLLSTKERTQGPKAVAGTRTFLNDPPSPNTTIDDIINMDFLGAPSLPIKDLLSTTAGPFCYIYL